MADIASLIQTTAQKYNIDPALLWAQVQQESSGNPGAWNHTGGGQGAVGLMQVRAPALADYNAANGTNYTMSQMHGNAGMGLDVGAWYLNQQLNKYPSAEQALTAYYAGPGSDAVKQGTSQYAQQVLGRMQGWQGANAYGSQGAAQAAPPPQPSASAAPMTQMPPILPSGDGQQVYTQGVPVPANAAPANMMGAAPGNASGAAALAAQYGYAPNGAPLQTAQGGTGVPSPANPSAGAAALAAQYGYNADGTPIPSKAPQAAPTAAPAVGVSSQPPPSPGVSGALAQMGYGPDGKPSASAQQANSILRNITEQSARVIATAKGINVDGALPPVGEDAGTLYNLAHGYDEYGLPVGETWHPAGSFMTGHGDPIKGATQNIVRAMDWAGHLFAPDSQFTRNADAAVPQVDQAIEAQNLAYHAARAPSAGFDWGRLAGNVAGGALLLALNPREAAADAGAATLGLGGRILRNLAPNAVAGMAMTPVEQNAQDHFWAQKGVQAGLGGLFGAGAEGVGSILRVLGNRLTPATSAILANLREAVGGSPVRQAADSTVAGVQPTLAEATGNPAIAAAQAAYRRANPEPFAQREAQNEAARVAALQDVARTPDEITAQHEAATQAAQRQYAAAAVHELEPDAQFAQMVGSPGAAPILKRAEELTTPGSGESPFAQARAAQQAERNQAWASLAGTPQQLEGMEAARNASVNGLYREAAQQELPVDDTLQTLMQRPSFGRVIQRAQRLSDEEGAGPIFVQGANGAPASLSGGAAHYLKQGLDDEIQLARDNNLGASERRALYGTQGDYLDWLDAQSPAYAQARGMYAEQSQPIGAMKLFQDANVTDGQGNVTLPKLDTLIKQIEQSRAGPGLSAAKQVSDDQMAQLYALRSGLRSDAGGVPVSRYTPDMVQGIQQAVDDIKPTGTPAQQQTQQATLDALRNWYAQRAPQYAASRETAAQASAQQAARTWLQRNLTDKNGDVSPARARRALAQIGQAQAGLPGSVPAAGNVDAAAIQRMQAIDASVQASQQAAQAKPGPQTLARWNMQPAQAAHSPVGSLAGTLAGHGAAMGTGYLLGGLLVPGIGHALGPAVGEMLAGSISRNMAERAAMRASVRQSALMQAAERAFLNPADTIQAMNAPPAVGQQILRLLSKTNLHPGAAAAVGTGPVFRNLVQ